MILIPPVHWVHHNTLLRYCDILRMLASPSTNFMCNLNCVHTVHVTRNFMKSDKFCRNSAQNCSTTSAECVSHFCGMILRCLRICPNPVNISVLRRTSLLYTNMVHKLRTGSYVQKLYTMQSIYVSLRLLVTVRPR